MHYLHLSHLKHKLKNSLANLLKQDKQMGEESFFLFSSMLPLMGLFFDSHAHILEQNGLVERKHRHIVETVFALLAQSSLPYKFWDDASKTAMFLINKLPISIVNGKIPCEKLYENPPNYSTLRVFGCQWFPNLCPYHKHKMHFHSKPYTFLGHNNRYKAISVLSQDGHLYIARNVLFYETIFPYASNISSDKSHAGI